MFEGITEDVPPLRIWGLPYFSPLAGQWLIAWFDATPSLEAVTRPTYEEQAWIDTNPGAIERMLADFRAYCDARGVGRLVDNLKPGSILVFDQ